MVYDIFSIKIGAWGTSTMTDVYNLVSLDGIDGVIAS